MAILKNNGSVARDNRANERTFLAWTRTALGVIGLGVALEKIAASEDKGVAVIAGAILIVYGMIILGYAIARFDRVTKQLEDGNFPVARRGPELIGALALMIAAGALAFVLF